MVQRLPWKTATLYFILIHIYSCKKTLPHRQNAELVKFLAGHLLFTVFTARGYAKRGICRRRVSVCLCVCVCVCQILVLYQNG